MTFWEYLDDNLRVVLFYSQQHFLVVLYSLVLATLISLVLALVLHTNRLTPESWSRRVRAGSTEGALLVAAALLTLPSFAFFASMQPFMGTGAGPTIVVLTVYGIYPVLRNIVAGLGSVDPAVLESAKGMGMGTVRRIVKVQLPLAWPVILSGIRVTTLILISIAVVAAYFRGPGLGQLLLDGLNRFGSTGAWHDVIAGTVFCILVAAVYEIAFFVIKLITTPRGIRA